MSSESGPNSELRFLDPIKLFHLCAADRENSAAWSEFLRRYSDRLKKFIYGTVLQYLGYQTGSGLEKSSDLYEDLFQNAIMRLVEDDCSAMRRFSGESERDLLAYLAVICRSSVLDSLRRNSALKRKHAVVDNDTLITRAFGSQRLMEQSDFEREILVRELVSLTKDAIKSYSGEVSNRDQLVFEMHFFDGLSYSQISECKGINLSKTGVQKLLKRLVDRVQSVVSGGKSEETLQ